MPKLTENKHSKKKKSENDTQDEYEDNEYLKLFNEFSELKKLVFSLINKQKSTFYKLFIIYFFQK